MSTIDSKVHDEIQRQLAEIERAHAVRILYACESGSRAWGFESQDSDYDVRFLYVREQDWYLAIDVERKRDVIELPIDEVLDINGWDLRKALPLFLKSNPPLYEWLVSPIVYREHGVAAGQLRQLAERAYNPIAAHYHYLRMAENNYRPLANAELVRRKKYLYVLRPLLAVRWIESEMGVVPTEFQRLVDGVLDAERDVELLEQIAELVRIKRLGKETEKGARLPVIDRFLADELDRHQKDPPQAPAKGLDVETLNTLFRRVLHESHSPMSQE